MPMGFEYGCRTRLDVVASRPGDWEWESAQPRIDLTGFIGAVNRMQAATPALNVEGTQRSHRAAQPAGRPAAPLGRWLPSSEVAAIVLVNPDPARPGGSIPGRCSARPAPDRRASRTSRPEAPALPFEPGQPITLEPLQLRVFRGQAAHCGRPRGRKAPRPQASEQRLLALTATRVVIERAARAGRRPARDQAHGRRHRRGSRPTSSATAATRSPLDQIPCAGRARTGASAPLAHRRRRPLGRPVSGHPRRPLPLHDRGLARPVRELAQRGDEDARRRSRRRRSS